MIPWFRKKSLTTLVEQIATDIENAAGSHLAGLYLYGSNLESLFVTLDGGLPARNEFDGPLRLLTLVDQLDVGLLSELAQVFASGHA